MRQVFAQQLQLGQSDIAQIEFNARSRDDIPQILQGLQFIYTDESLRESVFAILLDLVPDKVAVDRGRPGMDLWKAFVLATLRVNLNWDYDRLLEMANEHGTIRQMLGHGLRDDGDRYKLQTIKDNVDLLDEASLQAINKLVVDAGHRLLKKNETELRARCDSFVVETNVHYPTDLNLLWDAMRCALRIVAQCCEAHKVGGWRQWQYNTKRVKAACRQLQKLKRSTSKDPEQRAKQQQVIQSACEDYLTLCSDYLCRMEDTLQSWGITEWVMGTAEAELQRHMASAYKQIDLIRRRLLEGEKIPHAEKVFSLFEDYTEWLCKGKAGVPVELGLNVCVMESSVGFILHHKVMQKCTDSEIAVDMVKETQALFPNLNACSFDKGFHSPDNQKELAALLDHVVLPVKGKPSKARKAIESDPDFVAARRQHSAVESGINALEVHGLDRCPDRGLDHFKRYIALAVVGRNLQKLGSILQARALKKRQREEPRRRAA